jgi:hypothetical protein
MRLAMAAVFMVFAFGSASAETRSVAAFDAISASAGVPVEVNIGPNFHVEVTGRDAARIETRVEGRTLVILPTGRWNWGRRDAEVTVTMPAVTGLDASSGAHIRANQVSSSSMALDASSGASVRVSGSCGVVTADASSGAQIDAERLECASGSADVSSGARIKLNVSGRLNVDASSGGDVLASGSPELGDISLSSGGSLRRVDR